MKNKILFAVFAVLLFIITAYAASAQFITSEPPATAVVGQEYRYQMTTNITNVTYGIVNAPSGFGVNMNTGLYVWAPVSTGNFTVTLIATDNTNSSNAHMQQFVIRVTSVEASSMLEITKIVVEVNGDKEDTMTSEGTIDYDNFELNDDITLKINVENRFPSRNDSTEMDRVELEVSSNDLDDADGLDDEISGTLQAGEDEDMTVSFSLDPENVDPSDAPFEITVDVRGELEDGTVYRDSWTIKLDMETKSRDLYMFNVQASPLSFTSCSENRIRVSMDLKNIGSRDLDDAAIWMRISDISASKIVGDIEIDSGDDDTFSDFLTIPKGARAGTYVLEIKALPQRSSSTSTSETEYDVTILPCTTPGNTSGTGTGTTPGTGTSTGGTGTGSGTGSGTVVIPDVTISGTPVASSVGKKGLFTADNTLYIILLVVLVALLVTVIALLVLKIREA